MDAFSKIRTTKRLTNLLFYGILCVIESDKIFVFFPRKFPIFAYTTHIFSHFLRTVFVRIPSLKIFMKFYKSSASCTGVSPKGFFCGTPV